MIATQKKLGRLKPKFDRRTLQFAKYFSTLPYVPQTSHWLNAPPLGMLMNDSIGDCTIAGIGHAQRIWSKQNNIDYAMTDAQALEAYIAVTALENNGVGYNPSTGENDNGCACLDVLKYARNTGIGGQKIGPYVQVDVSNHSHVEHAQFWFGGLYIGINMPVSAQSQPTMWDVPKGGLTGPGTPGSWGGHCTFECGCSPIGLDTVTWGERITMTWNFWDAYVEECYAIISPDFVANPVKAPNGLNMQALIADLALVTT